MDPRGKVLPAGALATVKVENSVGESLGKIEELIIDLASGRVAFAVLSVGGRKGMGEKLFAIPWSQLKPDAEREGIFILDIPKEYSYPSLETSTLTGRGTGSPFLRRAVTAPNQPQLYKAGGR
jgi:sporulation protein YlmC with PRC-barrel domain